MQHELTNTMLPPGGARCVGRPETEHSWFPGYAWTIANCARCRQHMVGGLGPAGCVLGACGTARSVVGVQVATTPGMRGSRPMPHAYVWPKAVGADAMQGWRFTAVEPGLSPREFWGLRRTSITCTRLQLQMLQQGDDDTEEPEEDEEGEVTEEGQGMADADSGDTSIASSSHGDEDTRGEEGTEDGDDDYDGRDSVDEVVQQQETSSGSGSEREDEEGGQEGGTEAGGGDGGPRWPFLQLERWLRRRWELTEGGRAHRAARAAAAVAGAAGGGGGAADTVAGGEVGGTGRGRRGWARIRGPGESPGGWGRARGGGAGVVEGRRGGGRRNDARSARQANEGRNSYAWHRVCMSQALE